jgi:transposase-like protein
VSRICAGLDEVVTAFRTRRLDHTEFPYVYLDATYLHVRNATSPVVSMAVVVATGITTDGGREVLGLDVGDSEDEVFWRGFLSALKRRGLTGVRLVISDQHAGLVAARKRSFQGTAKVEVLAFTAFPRAHWPKVWSTNPLERVNKQIKRRAPGRGHLPQRRRRDPPRRGHPDRHARRMAVRRAPRPVRGLHGPTQPDQRYWRHRRDRQRRVDTRYLTAQPAS